MSKSGFEFQIDFGSKSMNMLGNTMKSIKSKIEFRVWKQTDHQVRVQVLDQVDDRVYDQIWVQLDERVYDQIWDQIHELVMFELVMNCENYHEKY